MVVAVKTREFEHEFDYDWEDYFPSDKVLSVEAAKIHRALEGAYVDGRFATIMRSSVDARVTLGVSVSTNRSDSPGRPIRTIAFFRAPDPSEASLLARFFAECLRNSDKETLEEANAPLAKAVESLYQTKEADGFIEFCRRLPSLAMTNTPLAGRLAIPRNNVDCRKEVADVLPSLVGSSEPFLIALTDRAPTDVLAALGPMFDNAVVRIFSKATTEVVSLTPPHEDTSEGGMQKYVRAAAIGGAVILAVLVAAIGSCSRGCGKGSDKGATSAVFSTGGAGTNAAPSQGIVEAND